MKLTNLTVSGFKNITSTTIRLERITALVSPNNYGKSNLLEAINFGKVFMSASAKDRLKMMSWVRGIPLTSSVEAKEYSFEVTLEEPALAEHRFVRYGFSFRWFRNDGSGQRITDEWLETRPSENVRYSTFIKRSEGKYRKAKGTKSFRKINVSDSQLIIDLLPTLPDVNLTPVIENLHKIDFRICASLDLSNRFQAPPIDFVNPASEEGITFDDYDVPRALYQLKTADPSKYELFLEAVYNLFPEFSEIWIQAFELRQEQANDGAHLSATPNASNELPIPFRMRNEIYRLVVSSKYLNQPVDLASMSAGTKRIIWLLANVFIASAQKISCIGIEELETSIHPRLLKTLLETLNEVLDDTMLVISSHSSCLIQYVKPTNLYLGIPNEQGIATFSKLNSSRLKRLTELARGYGLAVGEFLFELMTGDRDSARTLSFYLED